MNKQGADPSADAPRWDPAGVAEPTTPADDDPARAGDATSPGMSGGISGSMVDTVTIYNQMAFASGPVAPALTTGPVRTTTLERATHAYVRPSTFRAALKMLREARLLVVRGARGSGREAMALNLLRELQPEDPIEALSPTTTWGQLSTWSFRDGTTYVISEHQDRALDLDGLDVLCTRIEKSLHDAGSRCRLVVTTGPDAPRPEGVKTVEISAPNPADVVDAELDAHGGHLDAAERTELLEVARMDPKPGAVSRLVERALDDERGPTDFLAEARNATTAVSEELDKVASNDELAIIVTLAFFPDSPLSEFDRLAAALTGELNAELATAPSAEASVIVARRRMITALPLAVLRDDEVDEFGTRDTIVAPRHDSYQDHCFQELSARHFGELWMPVYRWLDGVVARLDNGATGLRRKAQIADSLAVLARYRPSAVISQYVESWIDRPAREERGGSPHFAVAAMTLSLLDPSAGSTHLRATSWCRGRDDNRAVAAALALSGALGLSNPFDTLNALWDFGARVTRIRLSQSCMTRLFAIAVDTEVDASAVFRFARKKVGVTARLRPTQRSRPFDLLIALMTDRPVDAEPMPCTRLLARSPLAVHQLVGALYPAFLQLGFRAKAINALFAVLDDAQHHFPHVGVPAIAAQALDRVLEPPEIDELRRAMLATLDSQRTWPHLAGSRSTFMTPFPRSQPVTSSRPS